MLRDRYDPQHIHSYEEWEAVAQNAVAMVSSARELMDMTPPAANILL